jgi:hypothetical protein
VPARIFHRFHIGAAAISKAAATPWGLHRTQMRVRVSRLMKRTYHHVGKGRKFLTAGIELRHFRRHAVDKALDGATVRISPNKLLPLDTRQIVTRR